MPEVYFLTPLSLLQACLKFHTTTNLTAQKIHDMGLSEVQSGVFVRRRRMGEIIHWFLYLFCNLGHKLGLLDDGSYVLSL